MKEGEEEGEELWRGMGTWTSNHLPQNGTERVSDHPSAQVPHNYKELRGEGLTQEPKVLYAWIHTHLALNKAVYPVLEM